MQSRCYSIVVNRQRSSVIFRWAAVELVAHKEKPSHQALRFVERHGVMPLLAAFCLSPLQTEGFQFQGSEGRAKGLLSEALCSLRVGFSGAFEEAGSCRTLNPT